VKQDADQDPVSSFLSSISVAGRDPAPLHLAPTIQTRASDIESLSKSFISEAAPLSNVLGAWAWLLIRYQKLRTARMTGGTTKNDLSLRN
jgi:hypothetical protein